MTVQEVEEFIEHFGKKGMHWGVRNDRVVGTDGGVNVTKGDAKWGAKTLTPKAIIAVNNRMALAIDKDLVGLNARYEGKNLGFNDKTGQYTNPTGKQYLKDYENIATKHATKAAQDVFGKSPSGNWTASARFSMTSGLEVNIVPSKVVHDGLTQNGDGVNITFQVKIDSSGFLLPISSDIKHSFNDVDEFLEHFGKKGMKWGVRSQARQANRALNRASRASDKQDYQNTIDKARQRIDSGKTDAAFYKAKTAYSKNRQELGSRRAKQILREAKDKRMSEYETASQVKNGKEAATQLLVGVGVALISAAVRSVPK